MVMAWMIAAKILLSNCVVFFCLYYMSLRCSSLILLIALKVQMALITADSYLAKNDLIK